MKQFDHKQIVLSTSRAYLLVSTEYVPAAHELQFTDPEKKDCEARQTTDKHGVSLEHVQSIIDLRQNHKTTKTVATG